MVRRAAKSRACSIRGGDMRDLSTVIPDLSGDSLHPDSIDRLRHLDPVRTSAASTGDVRIGPCVGRVGKFICIGLNYSDHAAESGMAVPAEPILFMKATSAICGPNDDILIPRGSQKTDWEVELGVVIGKTAQVRDRGGRAVARRGLLRRQRSVRARVPARGHGPVGQRQERRHVRPDRSVARHARTKFPIRRISSCGSKSTAARYQRSTTRHMIFGVARLVSYISRFMSLHPGDIISTGTPPGIGMGQKPPVYLRPGNHVRLGIQGLGEQSQRVTAADARM